MVNINEIKCNKKQGTSNESIKEFMIKQSLFDGPGQENRQECSEEESIDNNGKSNEKIYYTFDMVKTDPIITLINS